MNNVVYKNEFAGIRVGDGVGGSHITNISHNTVAENGGGTTLDQAVAGGGIVYHDGYDSTGTTPCYYCKPHGTLGSEERDYNLIYSNNIQPGSPEWMTADCGYVAALGDYSTGQIDFKCLSGQYGFQPLYWDNSVLKTQDPNDILDDPLFVSMTTGSEDYQLDTGSPGIGAGSDATDMGAWGGTGTFSTPYGSGYNVYMDW
jgi:hypothetical protein